MDEKKIIRVGAVGTGMIFNRHNKGITKSPDAVLMAICDTDEKMLAKKAEECGLTKEQTFTDYRDMLDSGLIDAVLIATPNSTHVPIALEAIKRGIPYTVEKPVGLKVEEVEKLYKATVEADIKNTVLFAYRFKAAARYARHIIESGAIGEIYHVYVEYLQDYDMRPYSLPTFWRFDEKLAGGGVVYDLSSHMMDLVSFMTGLEYKSICASEGNIVASRPDPVTHEMRKVSTDDFHNMIVEFKSGATGTFSVSKCCMGRKNYQKIQMYGTKGVVIYYLLDNKELEDAIEVCIGDCYMDSYKFSKLDIPAEYYADQMQGFFDVINGCGDGLTATIKDGLISQRMIEKVYESAEKHSWIDVSDCGNL